MANVWGTEAEPGMAEPNIQILDDDWDDDTETVDLGDYVRRLRQHADDEARRLR